MPIMQWSEKYELGVARMDTTHREFIELYNAMCNASPETFLACLDVFIAHTEQHFGQENYWMQRVNFPLCHKGEHDRVLDIMREVRTLTVAGDRSYADQLLEELPAWFDEHAASMDTALALYLKSAQYDVENDSFARVDPGPNIPEDDEHPLKTR